MCSGKVTASPVCLHRPELHSVEHLYVVGVAPEGSLSLYTSMCNGLGKESTVWLYLAYRWCGNVCLIQWETVWLKLCPVTIRLRFPFLRWQYQ